MLPGGAGSGSTSSSLLEGLKRKEPEAWQRLAQLYGPLVYSWCRRKRLQAGDAEDVVQEVFLTVAGRIAGFRHDQAGATFRGWLWTITRNKLGDWIRRQKKQERTAGPDLLQEENIPPDDAQDGPGAGELGALCRQAMDQIRGEFEDRTWQAFWQMVVEGQDPGTVAAGLNMTCNAVYIAKSRILRRLREVLGDA